MTGLELLLSAALLFAMPLALATPPPVDGRGRAAGRWARTVAIPASLVLVASIRMDGPSGVLLAVPWLLAALRAAFDAVRRFVANTDRYRLAPRSAEDLALVFWFVGASAEIAFRTRSEVFGLDPLLIRLAVVHFHVAGVVLLIAGAAAVRRRSSPWTRLALGALAAGIPLTAIGFLGLPLVNWAGAMLVVAGAIGVAAAHVSIAADFDDDLIPMGARIALGLAGLALLPSMAMAAAFATATTFHLSVAASVGTMIAVHGTLNVLGFALPSMLGWWLIRRSPDRSIAQSTASVDAVR